MLLRAAHDLVELRPVAGGHYPGAPTALGTPAVVSVGTAATLHPGHAPGDLVLCTKALRGEGLSRHYLPPGQFTHPDPHLTNALAKALTTLGAGFRQGAAWTTDAPYRESVAEVRLYAQHQILVADMEAAGLFAVGHHRNLPTAAAFTVVDSLVHRTPRTDSLHTADALQLLLTAVLDALTGPSGPRAPGRTATVDAPGDEDKEGRRA